MKISDEKLLAFFTWPSRLWPDHWSTYTKAFWSGMFVGTLFGLAACLVIFVVALLFA